jgi:hypothetical protein
LSSICWACKAILISDSLPLSLVISDSLIAQGHRIRSPSPFRSPLAMPRAGCGGELRLIDVPAARLNTADCERSRARRRREQVLISIAVSPYRWIAVFDTATD